MGLGKNMVPGKLSETHLRLLAMVEMVPELAIYCKQIGDFLIGIRDTLSSN